MEKKAYICATCGASAEEPGHLCNPQGKATCSFCGKLHQAHEKHYCKGKLESIKYVCEGCGRLSTNEEFLCRPKVIPT